MAWSIESPIDLESYNFYKPGKAGTFFKNMEVMKFYLLLNESKNFLVWAKTIIGHKKFVEQ